MLERLIARYGLIAIFVGAAVEGEPFAIGGGMLAHQRLIPLWASIVAAIAGAFLIDLFWFLLGRRFRSHSRVRALADRPGFARSLASFERRPRRFIFLFRYAYGLRILAPLAIGTTRVPVLRFVRVSALAAVVWASIYSLVGFVFGKSLAPWIGHNAPVVVVAGLAAVTVPLVLVKGVRHRRAANPSA